MAPETITALSFTNGSVLISWKDSSMGWKTSKRRVKVIDENAKTLMTALSRNNQNELLVPSSDLEADQTYELSFAPEGPNIPDFIQEFSTTLALCKFFFIPELPNVRNGLSSFVHSLLSFLIARLARSDPRNHFSVVKKKLFVSIYSILAYFTMFSFRVLTCLRIV